MAFVGASGAWTGDLVDSFSDKRIESVVYNGEDCLMVLV